MSAPLDKDVLDALRSSAVAAMRKMTTRRPWSELIQTMDAVDSILAEAKALVRHEWNEENKDALSLLPVELHVKCFRFLDLYGRVRCSHVCRRWRLVAQHEPTLWNEYYADSRKRNHPSMLPTLIARSGTTDFSLAWHGYLPDYLVELIRGTMHRIIFLDIKEVEQRTIATLLAQHAPKLQILRYLYKRKWHTRVELPRPDNAPTLHHIHLPGFSMPSPFKPMPSVLTFTSSVVDCDARRISELFPSLQELALNRISTTSLLPTSLPPDLRRLTLTGYGDVDYANHLSPWTGPPSLQSVYIQGATSFYPVANFLFSSRGHEDEQKWSMTLHNVNMKLSQGDGYKAEVMFAEQYFFSSQYDDRSRCGFLLGRVEHLELGSVWQTFLVSELVLENLQHLTIVLSSRRDMAEIFNADSGGPKHVYSIRAPALKVLTIRTAGAFNQEPEVEFMVVCLLKCITNVVIFDSDRLDKICIASQLDRTALRQDYTSILAMTHSLVLSEA